MIKDILAVVDNPERSRPFVAQLLAFAAAQGAHVEIAALKASPYLAAQLLPVGAAYVPDEWLAADSENDVAALSALVANASTSTEVFGLHDDIAWLAGDLRRSRQLADVIMLGAPEHWETPWLRRRVLETMIFGGGTPVLTIPAGSGIASIRHAVLGWKPAPEAARAVHDLVILAEPGAQVDVVIVEQDAGKDGGDHVSRHLVRHGLVPALHRLDRNGRRTSEVLNDFAKQSGADLLALGAYARSRIRQIMFGGVTEGVIEGADVPVMFSH